MARRTLAYECRFCGKLFTKYNIAIRHERSCTKNPNSVNCLDCKHCNMDFTIEKDNEFIIKQPHCMLKDLKCSKAVSGNCSDFDRR